MLDLAYWEANNAVSGCGWVGWNTQFATGLSCGPKDVSPALWIGSSRSSFHHYKKKILPWFERRLFEFGMLPDSSDLVLHKWYIVLSGRETLPQVSFGLMVRL